MLLQDFVQKTNIRLDTDGRCIPTFHWHGTVTFQFYCWSVDIPENSSCASRKQLAAPAQKYLNNVAPDQHSFPAIRLVDVLKQWLWQVWTLLGFAPWGPQPRSMFSCFVWDAKGMGEGCTYFRILSVSGNEWVGKVNRWWSHTSFGGCFPVTTKPP